MCVNGLYAMQREIAPIHGAYGTAVTSNHVAVSPGREIASRGPHATIPYAPRKAPDRSKRCTANNNTCNAYRTKDSDQCVGHNKKAAAEAAESESEVSADELATVA